MNLQNVRQNRSHISLSEFYEDNFSENRFSILLLVNEILVHVGQINENSKLPHNSHLVFLSAQISVRTNWTPRV